MKVKRYLAPTSREAFARVKKELGADAVILANRSSQGGVEILALAHKDVGGFTSETSHPPASRAPASRQPAPRQPSPPQAQAAPRQAQAAPVELPLKDFARKLDPVADAGNAKLYAELKAMRGLVEEQLARFSWTEDARRHPLRAQLLRDMIAAGWSAPLGRKVSAALPDGLAAEPARAWLRGVLQKNLACATEADNLVERGGVYALVGPTGVGKTTTVAKLAARFVVRFGAQRLALISTDSYRIGAQDQLRIYARILGVAVHAVQDAASLRDTLAALGDKRLVLIDTVGMGQRDARLAEQHELLAERRVQRVLLLNAASQIETLEDVVRGYAGGAKSAFAGAIITKLDEARRAGGALDVAMRHRLRLAFVTDGQRVPEDIRLPQASELVASALEGAAQSPFALEDAELFNLPAAAGAAGAAALRQAA